MMEKKLVMYGE